MVVRVATFNLNNLFDRFNFHATIPERARLTATYRWRVDRHRTVVPRDPDAPDVFQEDGETIVRGAGPSVKMELDSFNRVIRAKNRDHLNAVIARTELLAADVLAVQEVENLEALRTFNRLLDSAYPFLSIIEGNDPRLIDVGVLSRFPLRRAISHRWEPDPFAATRFVFGRDLLAVEIVDDHDEFLFTLWINHLKSKFVDPELEDPQEIADAQNQNSARRRRQAEAIRSILRRYYGNEIFSHRFLVLGDMNDAPNSSPLAPIRDPSLGLRDVFHAGANVSFEHADDRGPIVRNAEDQPPSEDWTHRHSRTNEPDSYERLDQIWLSGALHESQTNAAIQRRTHWNKAQAGSDHDPVWVELDPGRF